MSHVHFVQAGAALENHLEKLCSAIISAAPNLGISRHGKVIRVSGMRIEASGLNVTPGTVCEIDAGNHTVQAEVTAFSRNSTYLMAMTRTDGVCHGARVTPVSLTDVIGVCDMLVSRVIDPLGCPLDGREVIKTNTFQALRSVDINPLHREKIYKPLDVGVRAINGLLTVGLGQRIGIFAGSGVGKSVLLGMITRFCKADITVIGLIGERSREVREFIENNLGEEGLKRSVAVISAADTAPVMRARAALTATAIAEYFRDQGKNVLLIVDSITRYAHALREIATSAGEPPSNRGYSPSVFSSLSSLVERAGMGVKPGGSITACYTVLVEGDDHEEPIADHMRSVLDGHIVLSRELAGSGHFPAIDVLRSASRVMHAVADDEHISAAGMFRKTYAEYENHREMIMMGMYQRGTSEKLDKSVDLHSAMEGFLQQKMNECQDIKSSVSRMKKIFES